MNYQNQISHRVVLSLNCTGYSGADLDTAMPHFMADRKTQLELTWEPTVEGPESFRLVVEIAAGYIAGSAVKSFVQELSKDLYRWSKEGLASLFSEKDQSDGRTAVAFEDITIICWTNGEEELREFFGELPKLLESVDAEKSEVWRARLDANSQTWEVTPDDQK